MKKSVFTFALALLTAASAWAYDFKAGDLCYNITDETAKTVEVTYEYEKSSKNYSALSGAVNIPETVSYNSMTYSVTSIEDYAFAYCSKLRQVNIPGSVTSIGEWAFADCSKLTQVNIPFALCSALKQVNIGDGVTSIGDYAFAYCSALTQVTIPNSVTSIGEAAFANCSKLTQVAIPDGVTSIEGWTFQSCTALTEVNIPNSVTSIGYLAFGYCSALTQVTIGSGVTSIGESAFSSCSALTQVTWNAINCANFIYSTDAPFDDCPVTTFIFGDQVEHIPAYLLCYGMDKLTQVTIPESVESIGNDAFYNCDALTAVYYTGDVAGWCGITFTGSTSNPLLYAHNLYIGNTLVTELVIPDNVTEIKDYAFSGCSTLAEITVLATVPPTVGVDAFDGVSREIPVYVPAESLEDYWVAAVWEEFYYLQAMQTALHTPSMPESIRVHGGMLHNPQQLPVSLYDMQGRMVYSGTAATVSQPAGVYVVLCAGASGKVLF